MTGRGLILAAPKSGSGKTVITAGLLRHLCNRGIRAAAAKCGPDYIDPTFHALASGKACVNLDPWAMRPETLGGLVAGLESSAEFVLCEGVMGLFDGSGPDGEAGSTAQLARLTGWPVVLVVDGAGQGASLAAVVEGFARHDPAVPLAGVILNRVASPHHVDILRRVLGRFLPELPLLGIVFASDAIRLPARHLGLVPAGEQGETEPLVARAAQVLGEAIDIDRLVALAQPARGNSAACRPGLASLGRRIAIARDDAFLFTYAATLATWRAQGAEISFFSPLADEAPAASCDAIYLPGGYPELHAERLAAARHFRAGMHNAAKAGKAIYGECGGYMVLGETLVDADRRPHQMLGLLPLTTSFADPQRHLGYRRATLLICGPLGRAGTRFRGHEFHYATILHEGNAHPLFAACDIYDRNLGDAGLHQGSVAGSFIHLIDIED